MTTRVEGRGWQRYIPVNMLVVGDVLIAEDMGVSLVCNLLQSQDANTQTDASENRVASVLGSAILPPSRVPEWNPRTPYVVHTYSSFVSDRFPPRFRTYLSIPYITLFHLLHFRSPVD